MNMTLPPDLWADLFQLAKKQDRSVSNLASVLLRSAMEKQKVSAAFVPPTAEEVWAYCVERRNSVDPVSFHDFYKSKNWMVGKNKMKDWRRS